MQMIKSRSLKLAASFCGLGFLLWLIGLGVFASMVSADSEQLQTPTEAIVVLTGGSERISTGVTLLAQGAAETLFISGVGAAVSANDLVPMDQPERVELIDRVTIGSEAADTPGNAIETAAWVKQQEIRSIRLVTAAYHMPRSLREFQHRMPGVSIVPHPVFPEQVKRDWWRYPGTASLLATEYTKFLFSASRIWLSSLTGSNRDSVQ